MTTVPEPTERPHIERPIDLTDTPDRDAARPAPIPQHHPDEPGTGRPDADETAG